ncbi:MAG: LamG domain-containing protein, partial [Actinomycetota bacterium]|nr:LamG domain-containing protein [Actinomycetota bacterium]
ANLQTVTVSGLGLTWTDRGETFVTPQGQSGTSQVFQLHVFTAWTGDVAPAAGSITMQWGTTMTGGAWSISAWDGVDNAAGPVVQIVFGSDQLNATAPTVTLVSTSAATGTYGCVYAFNPTAGALAAGAGFTLFGYAEATGPAQKVGSEWRPDEDLTVDFGAVSGGWAIGAVEVREAVTQAPALSGAATVAGGGTPTGTGSKTASAAATVAGGGTPAATAVKAATSSVAVAGGGIPLAAASKAASGGAAVAGGGSPAPTATRTSTAAVQVAGGGAPVPVVIAGFHPSQVAGYYAHYEADTLTEAEGVALATWPDTSGAARDLTQATAANQPVVRTNSLNGLRTIEFTPTQFLTSATFADNAQPNTVFIVAKPDVLPSVLATTLVAFDGVASTRRWAVYAEQATNEWRAYAGAALNSTDVITAGQWYRIAVVFEGTTSDIVVDDAPAVRGSAGTHPVTAIRVGAHYDGTLGWDGNIAEVLVYDARVSDADIASIQQYLQDKWALGAAKSGSAVVAGGGSPSPATLHTASAAATVAGGGGPTAAIVAASSEGVVVAGGGTPVSAGSKQAQTGATVAGGGGPAPAGVASSLAGVVVAGGGAPSVATQKAGQAATEVAGGGTPVPATGAAAVSGTAVVAGGGGPSPATRKGGLTTTVVAGGGTAAPTGYKAVLAVAIVAGGGTAVVAAAKAGLVVVLVAGGGTPALATSKQTSGVAVVAGGGQVVVVGLAAGPVTALRVLLISREPAATVVSAEPAASATSSESAAAVVSAGPATAATSTEPARTLVTTEAGQ